MVAAEQTGDLLVRVEGRAGRITLNRPKALNALTYEMALGIERMLDQWRDDAGVEHIVIDATGDRAFCAGGDIQLLYDTGRAGDFEYGRTFWRDEYRLNAKIAHYPKPYVAVMNGIVMGGGVGVSAHGSHRIVSDGSMVAMPEVSIGFLPDVGGTLLLGRAPGRCGEYLGMSAARMGPADAIHAGFADLFVPSGRLDEMIEALCQGPIDVLEGFRAAPPAGDLAGAQAEIDRIFDQPSVPGILDALSGCGEAWAEKSLKSINRNAPLSVACALEAVRQGRRASRLEDCLSREYRFVYRSMEEADFLEGIRAAIIDKDRQPNWRIGEHGEVGAADVARLLAPLGEAELVWPAEA